MVEDVDQPGMGPARDLPRGVVRIPLRPDDSPHEVVASFVGFLQRRYSLDVIEHNLIEDQEGVVQMAAPSLSEQLRRLRLSCPQTFARSSALQSQNVHLRATVRELLTHTREEVAAIRANRVVGSGAEGSS
jgi:hypothetical protein